MIDGFIPPDGVTTNCMKDPDLFFSEIRSDINMAKRVCQGRQPGFDQCPFIMQCATAGLKAEYGVWGGLSAYEREQLSAQARRMQATA